MREIQVRVQTALLLDLSCVFGVLRIASLRLGLHSERGGRAQSARGTLSYRAGSEA
jgi:hypothetical protein